MERKGKERGSGSRSPKQLNTTSYYTTGRQVRKVGKGRLIKSHTGKKTPVHFRKTSIKKPQNKLVRCYSHFVTS